MSVAVCSRSFSRNRILRAELAARYEQIRFNDAGDVLAGTTLIEFLRGHDKAITGLDTLTEEVFAALPQLRVVSKYGVGLDMIDLHAARRHGVSVRWTPGVNRQAVAELAVGLMIALGRNLVPLAREMRASGWSRGGGSQLSSATVGVVGCGHVGQRVAGLCRAFGARILGHDIRAVTEFCAANDVTMMPFDELLEQSDIVSIHVPLDASTRGLIGASELARMKPSAFLVNTARGGIVDEPALKRALVEGRLAGAALDVFAVEPPIDRELLLLPNFVATPHIGGSTAEAVLAMGRAAIEGLDDRDRQISEAFTGDTA